MQDLKATLIGATGLIGSELFELLIEDEAFSEIKILVRREVDFKHPKVKTAIIDFEDEAAFQSEILAGSIIFCAVGTTNKKARGDKSKYRKVDYDIPVNAAKFGLGKGCKQFVLVSSYGANSSSSNFYTKLKGEVEDCLQELSIPSLAIFRPSILLGNRDEFRLGELTAKFLMNAFSFLLPTNVKPIQAKDVAKSMMIAAKKNPEGTQVYQYKEMMDSINK
jgi:uncharacterized protein YbjT (DUF2867 family)